VADNTTITSGVGTTIATDEASGAHYQRIKLTDGTADSTAVIPGDATSGLWVNVKSQGGISISQTPTITAGAYSAKDCVGGLLTFANATRVTGGSAVLNTVLIIDNDDEKAGLELWLFNANPTVAADNAAMTFSDANMLKFIGMVPIPTADYGSLANNGAATVRGVGLEFASASTSIYGQLKCTGTPTYTATSDLTVVLAIEYVN
jgi:hypothetical protein